MIFFSFILMAIAGLFKAAMDTLQFHYSDSVFTKLDPEFWNPELSWKNKYEMGMPGMGSAFPFSTTVLVFLTDGWHLMQAGTYLCMTLACVLYAPMHSWFFDAFILYAIRQSVFSLFYWVFRV